MASVFRRLFPRGSQIRGSRPPGTDPWGNNYVEYSPGKWGITVPAPAVNPVNFGAMALPSGIGTAVGVASLAARAMGAGERHIPVDPFATWNRPRELRPSPFVSNVARRGVSREQTFRDVFRDRDSSRGGGGLARGGQQGGRSRGGIGPQGRQGAR